MSVIGMRRNRYKGSPNLTPKIQIIQTYSGRSWIEPVRLRSGESRTWKNESSWNAC